MKRFFSVFAAALLLLAGAFAGLPARAAGTATVSVEAFSVGGGYLAQPAKLETDGSLRASVAVLSLLAQNGLTAFYGGTPENGFYLAYVASGAAAGSFNGYRCASSSYPPASPRALSFATAIDPAVKAYLTDHADYFDETDYETNFSGYLGEFVYTNGSGWMYTLNGSFTQKPLSDVYLRPGDTLRVRYTLYFGADLGGAEPALQKSFDDYIAAWAQPETTLPPEPQTAAPPATTAPAETAAPALTEAPAGTEPPTEPQTAAPHAEAGTESRAEEHAAAPAAETSAEPPSETAEAPAAPAEPSAPGETAATSAPAEAEPAPETLTVEALPDTPAPQSGGARKALVISAAAAVIAAAATAVIIAIIKRKKEKTNV